MRAQEGKGLVIVWKDWFILIRVLEQDIDSDAMLTAWQERTLDQS